MRRLSAHARRAAALLLTVPLLVAVPAATSHATTSHPSLLFSASDVPALQAKITSGVPKQAWDLLVRKVDSYVEVGPNYFVYQDPLYYGGGAINPDYRIHDAAWAQNETGSVLGDLAVAYALSGDTRYSRLAIDIMLQEGKYGFPMWKSGNNEPELGRGDLSKGMALAWDMTYAAWTAAERAQFVTYVNTNVSSLFNCLAPSWTHGISNWWGVCAGGTGLLALALEGEPGVSSSMTTLASNARGRILTFFDQVFGQYGDGREGYLYASYGLHNALPFVVAWQRIRGESLPALEPGILNVPRWLAMEQIPGHGEMWANRNDSNEMLTLWAEVLPYYYAIRPDGLTSWVWNHTMGVQGDDIFGAHAEPFYLAPGDVGDDFCTDLTQDPSRLPACWNSREATTLLYWQNIAPVSPASYGPLGQFYPEHGLVDFRSGFGNGANDVMGTFEVRHDSPGGHTQVDMGQFTLFGYGGQWAVDSGYAGGQNNVQMSGHSVVRPNCATSYADGSASTVDPFQVYGIVPGQSYARASTASLYGGALWAERGVFFSAAAGEPPVLAVADSVNLNNSTINYCWTMHTDATNALTILGHNFTAIAPNGAAMIGSVGGNATKPNLLVQPYTAGGWPSQHNILDSEIKVVALDHLAVVSLQPQFTYGSQATVVQPVANGNYADVTWTGGHIVVATTNHGVATLTAGPLTLTGRFGKLTENKGESVLDTGSLLSYGGRDYVKVTGGAATVLVGGDSVTVTGPTGLTCEVYAPQAIASVKVNGSAVAATRTGDYLTFAC